VSDTGTDAGADELAIGSRAVDGVAPKNRFSACV
jgi:hypothetical protein